MTAREPDPVQPTRCPWHASTDCVEPATDHERGRTGMAWWCSERRSLFSGTATEFQRERARVLADEAEALAARPKETDR